MVPAGSARRSAGLILGALVISVVAPATSDAQPSPRPSQSPPREREVAVVNAVSDQAAGARAAAELRRALERHPRLRPLRAGDLARSLEGAAPADDRESRALAAAQTAIDSARAALPYAGTRFDHAAALDAIGHGEAALLALPPSPAMLPLLTELAFQDGLAHIVAGDATAAERAFAAVKRLDPSRTGLSAAQYLPDVVEAFARAGSADQRGDLEVDSPFDGAVVYVDGQATGSTPAVISVVAGLHYVTAQLDDHRVIGERVVVAPSATAVAALRFEALAVDERALALRRRVAAGALAVADAAPQLAALTQVASVVILVDGGGVGPVGAGRLAVAFYDAATATLTAAEPVPGASAALDATAADALIAPLAPLDPVRPPVAGLGDDPPILPRDRRQPWYRRTWVQATVGGGLALTAIGIAALLLGGDDTVTPGPIGFEP